MRMSRRWS